MHLKCTLCVRRWGGFADDIVSADFLRRYLRRLQTRFSRPTAIIYKLSNALSADATI
jgi:hypothetical protein